MLAIVVTLNLAVIIFSSLKIKIDACDGFFCSSFLKLQLLIVWSLQQTVMAVVYFKNASVTLLVIKETV